MQERNGPARPAAAGDLLVRVARQVEHPDLGAELGHLLGYFPAAHLGHDDVGGQQVDGARVAASDRDRLGRAVCLQHLVAGPLQDGRDERPDRRLVLDQEDRLGPSRRPLSRPVRRWALVRLPGLGQRQGDAELCPTADLAVDLDLPAGLPDDAVHSGQPEAGPLADFLGGEERFEDTGLDLVGHPRAGVAHDEQG